MLYICTKGRTHISKNSATFHNSGLIWAKALNNVAPDCCFIVFQPHCEGWSAQQCRGDETCAVTRLSPPPLLSGVLLPPPPHPVHLPPPCYFHMTEEPPEQLGLGILVSRAIVCPLSLSPVCLIATSTDSQHQLIIATVAVKETHFGSDRLMTCKTCSYWVTNTSSRGSVCVTLALRTHYRADNLTH